MNKDKTLKILQDCIDQLKNISQEDFDNHIKKIGLDKFENQYKFLENERIKIEMKFSIEDYLNLLDLEDKAKEICFSGELFGIFTIKYILKAIETTIDLTREEILEYNSKEGENKSPFNILIK